MKWHIIISSQYLSLYSHLYYIYTNTITNIINIFEIELTYLTEYNLVSIIAKLSAKLINYINTNSFTLDDINELNDFVGQFIKKPVAQETNEHLALTKIYVDKNKNDQKETLASVVVDNVKSYLSENIPIVNQNQIGQDLVELGVKKTRKAKGFVYGIQDTSNKSAVDIYSPSFVCGFANKSNFRAEPIVPIIPNVSPFNVSSKIA